MIDSFCRVVAVCSVVAEDVRIGSVRVAGDRKYKLRRFGHDRNEPVRVVGCGKYLWQVAVFDECGERWSTCG